MPTPIQPPTYPAPMVESDMHFTALIDVMVADDIYFGISGYTEGDITTLYANQGAVKTELSTNFDLMGELVVRLDKRFCNHPNVQLLYKQSFDELYQSVEADIL